MQNTKENGTDKHSVPKSTQRGTTPIVGICPALCKKILN